MKKPFAWPSFYTLFVLIGLAACYFSTLAALKEYAYVVCSNEVIPTCQLQGPTSQFTSLSTIAIIGALFALYGAIQDVRQMSKGERRWIAALFKEEKTPAKKKRKKS